MSDFAFVEKIEVIIKALKNAGYDPYEQLYGYVLTGDSSYITRQDNARALIASLDKQELQQYLNSIKRWFLRKGD